MLSLWQFGLARYERQGVKALCLQLQDEYLANVVFLLTLVWLDCKKVRLNPNDYALLRDVASQWHFDVLMPLRQARRGIKRLHGSAGDSLYSTLLEQEMMLEKKVMQLLEETFLSLDSNAGDAVFGEAFQPYNLRVYLRDLQVDEVHIEQAIHCLYT